jgi:hypothetical protein
MANFAKHGKQSVKGWDAATGRQVVAVGGDAEVSLWGGGPGGVALEVSPNDASVCTVHERPAAPGDGNWRRFVITGLKEGDAMIEARLPGPGRTGGVWASMQVDVKKSSEAAHLVFFPNERTVTRTAPDGTITTVAMGTIYVVGGKGEHFSAAGGATVAHKDRGGHTAEPTPAGRYILGPKHHVVTASWPMSVIPFGASLRLNADGEVEFKGDTGDWKLATGPKGAVTSAKVAFMQRDGQKPNLNDVIARVRLIFVDPGTGALRFTTWELNDFGRWGWNLRQFSDKSGTAYYVHTTPDDEESDAARRAVFLANSHGCVHLVPGERDQMISSGYLKEGVEFDVRPYDETGPP